MNQFIDFGTAAISRHDIQKVFFPDERTAVVEGANGLREVFSGIDKASIMAQLNPPQPRHPQWAYFTNQEMK